jgi:hypothetical protein
MNEVKQRLHRAVVIQGDDWQLTTGVQSSDVETQSGSANTIAYTRWETVPKTEENTPLLWLGTVPQSTKLFGDNLLALLSVFGIKGMEHMHIVVLDEQLQQRFAMIAAELAALSQAGGEMSRLLVDWPENWPLRATLGIRSAQFTISGAKFDKSEDLDRIIRMGTGFLAYSAALNSHTKIIQEENV